MNTNFFEINLFSLIDIDKITALPPNYLNVTCSNGECLNAPCLNIGCGNESCNNISCSNTVC
jgi:hypothetical protein